MNNTVGQIVTVFTAIIGLAALAVVLSNRANTANVVKSTFSGLAEAISSATNPYSGSGLGGFTANI